MAFRGAQQTLRTTPGRLGVAAVAELPWKHFRAPLGSILVSGTFPVAAEPASRANEAAAEAKTTKTAKATFAQVFDIRKFHYDSLGPVFS